MTSDKLEDYARTIRPKINNHLPEYLIYFPTIKPRTNIWGDSNRSVDWDKLTEHVTRERDEVPEVEWCKPGESVALETLKDFARTRLMTYAADQNIPTKHNATSGLSPLKHLEKAQTTDPLWNASQLEMVHHGKMHGYMRMYWAKKIFEWTSSPQEAVEMAVYLNDKVLDESSILFRFMVFATTNMFNVYVKPSPEGSMGYEAKFLYSIGRGA
ncbi:putative deoxyribodipyrimidine photo-lyase [Helianthus anomalus]